MTYGASPADDINDEVRLLIGDTDNDNLYLTDDEIEYLVDAHGAAIRAAYHGALMLSARFSAKRRISVGTASIDYGAMATQFIELAKSLAARGGDAGTSSIAIGAPVAGGLAGGTRDDGTTIEMWSDVDWENKIHTDIKTDTGDEQQS